MNSELLSAKQAAKYLGVQPHTVYRLIDQGKMRAERRTKTSARANGEVRPRRDGTLIHRADLEAFITASRVRPGELRHLNPRQEAT